MFGMSFENSCLFFVWESFLNHRNSFLYQAYHFDQTSMLDSRCEDESFPFDEHSQNLFSLYNISKCFLPGKRCCLLVVEMISFDLAPRDFSIPPTIRQWCNRLGNRWPFGFWTFNFLEETKSNRKIEAEPNLYKESWKTLRLDSWYQFRTLERPLLSWQSKLRRYDRPLKRTRHYTRHSLIILDSLNYVSEYLW